MRAPIIFSLMVLPPPLCSGCSQNILLARQDYQKSQQDFVRGDAEKALLDFPRGAEDGTFITTIEKGYLSLIQGRPQIKELNTARACSVSNVALGGLNRRFLKTAS